MLLHDFIANLRHRWYLVVIGAIATALAAAGAFTAIPATYEAKASLLLLPPKSSVGTRGNPFLYLGGLNQALDVLSTRMNSEEVTKPVADQFPGLSLTIARDGTTSGPILVIDASSTDQQATLEVVDQMVSTAPGMLTRLQDTLQIPTNSRITVMNLNVDRIPRVDLKKDLRAAIALSAVGLGGTVVLTGLVDSMLAERRRRRSSPTGARRVDAELDGSSAPASDGATNKPRRRRQRREDPPGWEISADETTTDAREPVGSGHR